MNMTFPTPNFTSQLSKYRHQLDYLRIFESQKYSRSMLKWARRHGKSTMCFNILIRECLKTPKSRYSFIFTTREAAKKIITVDPQMMDMLPKQDGTKGPIWTLNKTDLTITFYNGSVLELLGADDPDRLRGFNSLGVVIDEWSQHKSDKVYVEIVEPVLARNGGWCIFIYTPCGVNHASEMYNAIISGKMGEEWYYNKVTADESGLISPVDLEKARQRMGDLLFRQEFLCEDLADSDLVIIPQQAIINLEHVRRTQKYDKRCIAVDPSLGGDECICYYMINSEVMTEKSITSRDTTVITAQIQQFANVSSCRNVVIDNIGIGQGPTDQLRKAGLNIIEFDARTKALDNNRFLNVKAEAWFHARLMIEQGKIPPIIDVELKKQLSAVHYCYSGTNQRIKCEDKKITKQRLGRSPDRADCFVSGLWAWDQLPDQAQYERLSNLDRERLYGKNNYSTWGA